MAERRPICLVSGRFVELPSGDTLPGGAGSSLDVTGVRLAFHMTTPPTGWTKDTTAALNNTCPRIVTGTVGSGGATAFTTVFGAGKTTGNASPGTNSVTVDVSVAALSTAQLAAHAHAPATGTSFRTAGTGTNQVAGGTTTTTSATTANAGSGSAHDHGTVAHSHTVDSHGHTLSLDLAYTDITIGEKD